MREKKLEPAMETNFERISYSEDEISLVDLVVTLLKRRKVFYLTFGVLLIITIFFTALTFLNKNEHITSVYHVALEGEVAEQPANIVEKIESFYKDLVFTELRDDSNIAKNQEFIKGLKKFRRPAYSLKTRTTIDSKRKRRYEEYST